MFWTKETTKLTKENVFRTKETDKVGYKWCFGTKENVFMTKETSKMD